MRFTRKGEPPILGIEFEDALVEHAQGVADGRIASTDQMVSDRQFILGALQPKLKPALRSRLVNIAIDSGGQCSDKFFNLFGEEVADRDAIRKHPDVVEGLFSRLVERRNTTGLRWLRGVVQADPQFLDEFDNAHDFRSRIQGEYGKPPEENDDAHQVMMEIADTLGIHAEQPPSGREPGPTA